MKDKFVHVCFIIDESGSMSDSILEVRNGYKEIIEQQKNNKEGSCAVSLYTFDSTVFKHFVGEDINNVSDTLNYSPSGMTAMNDGIGMAIDQIGVWLANMDESERPASNLIVIMTDGYENSSKEYSLATIQKMIKHQTEKYNWTFMYIGADITESKTAESLGVKYRGFSSKKNLGNTYCMLNDVIDSVRSVNANEALATMDFMATSYETTLNNQYLNDTGIDLTRSNDSSKLNS